MSFFKFTILMKEIKTTFVEIQSLTRHKLHLLNVTKSSTIHSLSNM